MKALLWNVTTDSTEPIVTPQQLEPLTLSGIDDPTQGRVYVSRVQGTVCADTWNLNNANVVCR